MKKLSLFTFTILLTSTLIGSNVVTATLQGPRLIFVAEEGAAVKKGEPLAKYRTASIEAQVKSAQSSLDTAEKNLKDKEGNFKRYQQLKEHDSVSAEKLEDVDLAYDNAVAKVADCKAELKEFQNLLAVSTISAPYDCKVSKVLISSNSGTEYGTQIMEISDDSSSDTSIAKSTDAQTLTSSMKGGVISYLPKEGEFVKKGEVLVKAYNPITIDKIDALKADIEEAEHTLQDKESKYNRYSKLKDKKSTSLNDFETAELAYYEAKSNLSQAKLNLAYYEDYNSVGSIVAPFDCKVTKVLLIVGGGTKDGTPIMEIAPMSNQTAAKAEKGIDTRLVTASLDDGFSISYLPTVGEIVKKDSPLVKYAASSIDIEIDSAKLALEYAKQDMKDKESKYKRCSYLSEKNSTSKEDCEGSKLAYETSMNTISDCEAKLTYLQEQKALSVISAPYECKVTKVMLVVGGGTKYSTPIMEIEPVKYL